MFRTLSIALLAVAAVAAGVMVFRGPVSDVPPSLAPTTQSLPLGLTSRPAGRTASGRAVRQWTLSGGRGVQVSFIDLGGRVTGIVTPDRRGRLGNVELGFPTLRDYETTDVRKRLYFGGLLGRYAGWIAGGRFRLGGRTHRVPLTDGPHTIHGGPQGFDKRTWAVTPLPTRDGRASARLTYVSADGEEGFPGRLSVAVTYAVSRDGTFSIAYGATTTKRTVVNLTSHLSLDLAGAGSPRGVLDHDLQVNASRYTPVDRRLIPLGTFASVAGTPWDLRRPARIGSRLRDPQLAPTRGYDSSWALEKSGDRTRPQPAAWVHDPASGRTLEVSTTEPGLVVYTANGFPAGLRGNGGAYRDYSALTLETQHVSDSPNQPRFPSTELRPGERFTSTTRFRFGVRR